MSLHLYDEFIVGGASFDAAEALPGSNVARELGGPVVSFDAEATGYTKAAREAQEVRPGEDKTIVPAVGALAVEPQDLYK